MKLRIGISLLVVLIITSCTKKFEELNTNPNAPNNVQPSLLLRQVIFDYAEQMSYEGFVAGNLLGQHFTMIDFNLFDRHNLSSPQLGGNPWPIIYTNLRDNELMLAKAKESPTNAVYEGPGVILKAYMAAALTDIYGDVPYFEAIKGNEGNVTPVYDSQEEIYTGADGILDNLKKGIAALEAYQGVQTLDGDILFNGNLAAWVTFAKSLQVKYLMRISDKVSVGTELQAIYDGADYQTTNNQNAVFNFTNSRPNSFRMATLRDGDFNSFILSLTAEEILNQLSDPRLNVLYRPKGNDNTGTVYAGLLNGPDASQTSISVSDYSLTGAIFRENTSTLKANFMTAWETHFLIAEAIERGLIAANSQQHYNQGVQLAFDYWNTTIPSDYLTTGNATFGSNGADVIEQIITQKWIASSINGYESWIEYRRTGFPQLKTISGSLNNNLIPSRMPYPSDEQVLNQTNFNAATATNGNSINVKVWWDAN
jgi:hypothetical protein